METDLRETDEELTLRLEVLPNLPDEDVPAGGKENNEVVKTGGEKPTFEYQIKDHVQLAEDLGLLDLERASKISGSNFSIYTGMGARLEWALINFFIDEHIKAGYEMIIPPNLVVRESAYTAGQLPKFEDDVYWTKEGLCLIPTAETVLTNIYRDEILDENSLPRKFFAYSPCYRKEAGSYRANEKGLIRMHQFNKVEMYQFTTEEKSEEALEEPPTTTTTTTTHKWLPVTGIGNDGKQISPEIDLPCESLGWNTYCKCIWNYNIKPGEYTKDAQIGETCTVDGKVITTPNPTDPPEPEEPPIPPAPEPEGCCLFNNSVEYKEVKECSGEILEDITEKNCQEKNNRINITKGVNFFVAPLVINSNEIAIGTAKELIDTSNKEILAVGLFRNDKWEKIVKNENGENYGTDFNLIPGEIYMITALQDIEIPIKTIDIDYKVDISNLIGWNLIPTSFFKNSVSRTKDILLNTDYSYIKQVAVWNKPQSLFDYTLRDNAGKVFGDSISISKEIGLFIKIPY